MSVPSSEQIEGVELIAADSPVAKAPDCDNSGNKNSMNDKSRLMIKGIDVLNVGNKSAPLLKL